MSDTGMNALVWVEGKHFGLRDEAPNCDKVTGTQTAVIFKARLHFMLTTSLHRA